ncbi:MAG: right-handed parallel beta-helix repeat-containing protein [Chloroflexi bacterium]|nr:right-handed parallel beta-helix repeat-containing protein [Chloroflexota bacterium]
MRELFLILSLLLPPSSQPLVVQQNNQVIDCQAEGRPVIVGNGSETGIVVQGKTGVIIQNCTVKGFDLGLLVADSSDVIVRNSDFSGNHVDDNSILDLGGWAPKGGMMFHNVTNSVIQNVTARGNVQGIQIVQGGNNTLRGSDASNNRGWGIRLLNSTGNRVEDNVASYNNRSCPEWGRNAGCESAGIVLVNSDNTTVVGNTANFSGDGIYQGNTPDRASHNNAFYWNTLNDNVANGIEATFSHDNRFIGNELQRNNYAFWLGYASWALVSGNYTNDNRVMDCRAEHSNNIVVEDNTFADCPQ